jgi:hypothetical protein
VLAVLAELVDSENLVVLVELAVLVELVVLESLVVSVAVVLVSSREVLVVSREANQAQEVLRLLWFPTKDSQEFS